jgi:lipopolysaccharide transport system permease protein
VGAVRWRSDLVTELIWRDVRLAYRGSLLGIAWSQVATLVQIAVLSLVFSRLVPLGIAHYPAFVFVGLLAWLWFSNGTQAAAASVVNSRDLIRRPAFPTALVPAIAVLTHLAYYLLALPVLAVTVAVSTGISVHILALPIVMAVQLVVMLGPAYALAAMNVRFRDVALMTGVGLNLLFYASGVFYAASRVPARFRRLFVFNPVAQLVDAYRRLFIEERWPLWSNLFVVAAVGVAATAAAYAFYSRREPRFVDQL